MSICDEYNRPDSPEHFAIEVRAFDTEVIELLTSGSPERLIEQQEVASWLTGYSFACPGVLERHHDDDMITMLEAARRIHEILSELEDMGDARQLPGKIELIRERAA